MRRRAGKRLAKKTRYWPFRVRVRYRSASGGDLENRGNGGTTVSVGLAQSPSVVYDNDNRWLD